ncbi:hypothetical protein D1007_51306 [Hordeum vulgare]|nr:hypothetical protein D1007_51306 [Hordeum vulgare]
MSSMADVGKLTAVRPDLSIPEKHLVKEAGEDVNYSAMPKASRQRASVFLYLQKAGYNIKLVDNDGLTRAMSQDTLCGGGLGSSIAKSYLINQDHEEGTHKGPSKMKQCICDIQRAHHGFVLFQLEGSRTSQLCINVMFNRAMRMFKLVE